MYGAYGHAQADINAFIIEAGSQPLAWRNGYYNYWGSDHHKYIAKASFTHNTITYDNGIGQANYENNFDADGVTTMYLSNTHMAAAVGDGREAYLGGLEKFDRTFIYLRPDSFIVIDNLEASDKNKKENGGSTFEWWLNSIGTIDVHDDNRGVAITNKEKALDARVHYPENAEPFYSNLLAGTDGIEIMPTPADVDDKVPQGRVWFKTDKVEKTKMVVTMDARDITKNAEYVKANKYDNYMELQFEDGTMVYVSLETDETQMVDTGEFKFNGTAVVKSIDHIMFIGGTDLYIRGEKAIEASRPVAVTMGFDELGVSSGDDYDITIYPNELYMPRVDSVRFRNDEEPVGMGMGVEVTKDKKTGALKVHADKGHYSFLLNNKPLPGDSKKGTYTYTLVIDGVEEVHKTTNLKYDPDYNVVASDYVVKTALKEGVDYAITEVEGKAKYNGKALTGSEALIYSPSNELYLEEDNCKIHIRTIKRVDVEGERTEDCDTREKEASVIVQAEDFVSVHKARHSAGAAFPCLAQLNDVDAEAVYDVEIPESGYYDFLFKYATSTTITQRFFEIDSTRYFFTCESTGSYGGKPSDFRVLTADTNIYLEKGKYKIKLGANGVGNVNIDWFGFIKKN